MTVVSAPSSSTFATPTSGTPGTLRAPRGLWRTTSARRPRTRRAGKRAATAAEEESEEDEEESANDESCRTKRILHPSSSSTSSPLGVPAYLASAPKDAPVMMYCTGGIRCDIYSAHLRRKGFTNLYTLEGGVHNYFKEVGGRGWEGSLFVFDARMAVAPRASGGAAAMGPAVQLQPLPPLLLPLPPRREEERRTAAGGRALPALRRPRLAAAPQLLQHRLQPPLHLLQGLRLQAHGLLLRGVRVRAEAAAAGESRGLLRHLGLRGRSRSSPATKSRRSRGCCCFPRRRSRGDELRSRIRAARQAQGQGREAEPGAGRGERREAAEEGGGEGRAGQERRRREKEEKDWEEKASEKRAPPATTRGRRGWPSSRL